MSDVICSICVISKFACERLFISIVREVGWIHFSANSMEQLFLSAGAAKFHRYEHDNFNNTSATIVECVLQHVLPETTLYS